MPSIAPQPLYAYIVPSIFRLFAMMTILGGSLTEPFENWMTMLTLLILESLLSPNLCCIRSPGLPRGGTMGMRATIADTMITASHIDFIIAEVTLNYHDLNHITIIHLHSNHTPIQFTKPQKSFFIHSPTHIDRTYLHLNSSISPYLHLNQSIIFFLHLNPIILIYLHLNLFILTNLLVYIFISLLSYLLQLNIY